MSLKEPLNGATMSKYEQLSTKDRIRVNAVIIEAFAHDDAFVSGFREQLKANSPNGDRRAGYQKTLDTLRESLTYDLKQIPQLTKAHADTNDLGAQKVLLRNLRDVMGDEKKGMEHSAAQIHEIVRRQKENGYGDQFRGEKFTIAEPATEYSGAKDMLARAAALNAVTGNMTSVTQATPEAQNNLKRPVGAAQSKF